VDRTAESHVGRAGCPCGEVIEVSFIDELATATLSTTPRRPRAWSEEPEARGWSATLTPSNRRLWAMALVLPFAFARMTLLQGRRGGLNDAFFLVSLALVATMGVLTGLFHKRAWTFTFRDGRFTADARGQHFDVGMDEILRFTTEKALRRFVPFELVIHRTEQAPSRVPLHVDSAEEAQFITDRANAVLANNGRGIEPGYRGERVRVAVERVGERVSSGPVEAGTELEEWENEDLPSRRNSA
jgi:hypothetical protein